MEIINSLTKTNAIDVEMDIRTMILKLKGSLRKQYFWAQAKTYLVDLFLQYPKHEDKGGSIRAGMSNTWPARRFWEEKKI